MEVIETDSDYYKLVEKARNPPFIIIKKRDMIVRDFETLIPNQVNIPKELHISNAVRIIYFPNSHVNLFLNYNEKPVDYVLDFAVDFEDLLRTPLAPATGITKEKVNDVKVLMKYLSSAGQTFFNNLFETALRKTSKRALEREHTAEKKQNNLKKKRKGKNVNEKKSFK